MKSGAARLRITLAILCVCVFLPFVASAKSAKQGSEILFQGFHWESYQYSEGDRPNGWYRILNSLVDDLASSGFTTIWLPPPSYAFEGNGRDPHSRGYMPIYYYQLNTSYGTQDELKSLIRAFQSKGVNVIADIVINHRTEPDPNKKCFFSWPDWGPWAVVRNDRNGCGQGNWDEGVEADFFSDLDHSNQKVREDIRDWLKWLRWDTGFNGWRYDLSRGYPGRYTEYYNRESSADFSVGEYWPDLNYGCNEGLCYNQDGPRQEILDWIDSTWKNSVTTSDRAAAAFDFITKGVLQEAVRNQTFWRLKDSTGHAIGLLGRWPSKTVTFIDNHDTGSSQQRWPFSNKPEDVMLGYAYILTHPGIPCVFYDHFYYWRDSSAQPLYHAIQKLMQVRREQSIQKDSSLQILAAEDALYAAVINGNVAMKLGRKPWSPGDGWRLAVSGQDYAVWER